MRTPAFVFALAAALPVLADPSLGLEAACAQADLIVIGPLGAPEVVDDGIGIPWATAGIPIKEILYGSEGAVARVGWDVLPPGTGHPTGWVDSPFEGKSGQERIWCLRRLPDGSYEAVSADGELTPDRRAEVEKAIEARLAPSRKALEDAKGPPPEEDGDTPEQEAARQLLKCRRIALAEARALLCKDALPQRLWGCALARELLAEELLPDVLPLLDHGDTAPKALAILSLIAKKDFPTPEEARAWTRSRQAP